ncbi:MAG TPA: hypothetical protein VEZ89_02545, partial [Rubrivivax sp.]|nr:hypothetical protein [Rubrivivax sp.]
RFLALLLVFILGMIAPSIAPLQATTTVVVLGGLQRLVLPWHSRASGSPPCACALSRFIGPVVKPGR